ncbi:TIGR04211 family SH3 domain-containing protein [Aliiglaciecola litoralis]|uniref:TIGR04211 family SH3 domain-containing protein n=1 Tax=Aliiglaciecola litoralis TaxID=582857 RepID=A0ABN1LE64_9ALTE
MTKFSILLIALVSLTPLSITAQQQQEPNDGSGDIRYVTDDLQAFMHSGPGRNYRILGSIVAGTRVSVLQENQEKGFVEVIDDTQRTGWIESQYITSQPSIRVVVPNLRSELEQANSQLEQMTQSTELLNQQVTDLTSRNARLVKDLEDIQKDNQRIQRELDVQDQSTQMKWFTRGGIIALISIIVGVIIAYLPKKRRRNDQWM